MKTIGWALALVVVGSVGISGVARADEPPTQPSSVEPGFVTLDRADDHSFVEIDAGVSFFDGEDPDFNVRMDLYGQYVSQTGFGGYGTIPIAYVADGDDSETAVGNLEFGGIYNLQQGPRTSIALRGGLMLPTADDDDLAEAIVRYATAYGRLTDLTSVSSETTWLRLAASPIYRDGELFFRADGGIDVAIDEPDGADVDPIVRLNLGAGFTAGSIAFTGELASIGTTGDVDEDEDRFYHTLGVSARGRLGGSAEGFGAMVVPLDADGIDYVLMAGVRVAIDR